MVRLVISGNLCIITLSETTATADNVLIPQQLLTNFKTYAYLSLNEFAVDLAYSLPLKKKMHSRCSSVEYIELSSKITFRYLLLMITNRYFLFDTRYSYTLVIFAQPLNTGVKNDTYYKLKKNCHKQIIIFNRNTTI